MKIEVHVKRAREQHHGALLALASLLAKGPVNKTGLQIWRQLARIEREASSIATAACNGTIGTDGLETKDAIIRTKVAKVFGGKLPPGFFFNKDPRGYSLKLEENSVPFPLHQDWGRYQILAPQID